MFRQILIGPKIGNGVKLIIKMIKNIDFNYFLTFYFVSLFSIKN